MNKSIHISSWTMVMLCIVTGLLPLTAFGAETGFRVNVAPPPPAADVDRDIPRGHAAGPFDVAVVIGNQDYRVKGVPSVAYAQRDMDAVKQYLIMAFGFTPKNIIEERNATKGTFETLFGTPGDPKGKLHYWVKPGKSRVLI